MPCQSEETAPRPGMWFISTLIMLELAILDGSASSLVDAATRLHIEVRRSAPPFFLWRFSERWYCSRSCKWFLLLSIVRLIFVERNILLDDLSSNARGTCYKVCPRVCPPWPLWASNLPRRFSNVAARFLQHAFLLGSIGNRSSCPHDTF